MRNQRYSSVYSSDLEPEEKMQHLLQEAQNIKDQLSKNPDTNELKQAMMEIYSVHDTAGILHGVCNVTGEDHWKIIGVYKQILSMVKQAKITE